jgi:adenylate kinase family enzyme
MRPMQRVAILGRGGAGKSTLARRLGAATGLPVIELDELFWRPGPEPTPPQQWTAIQQRILARPRWIIDGDLGPYDVLEPRLQAADTVIVLDLSVARCAWRAARRSREGPEFWRWLLTWRRRSRPPLLRATRAAPAQLVVLRTPRQARAWLARVSQP